jgi:hypothetical protein
VEAEAPELADAVRQRFAAHPHHVLATLHADGRPRVSGSNVMFTDGVLWVGSMPGARKAQDLGREPRCALHSAPLDATLPDTAADARVEAVAERLDPAAAGSLVAAAFGDEGPGEGEYFELLVTALSLVSVDGEEMVVRSWSPDSVERTVRRR